MAKEDTPKEVVVAQIPRQFPPTEAERGQLTEKLLAEAAEKGYKDVTRLRLQEIEIDGTYSARLLEVPQRKKRTLKTPRRATITDIQTRQNKP